MLYAINTPKHYIAKFLIPILEPLTHNEFAIKDSFNFDKGITNFNSSLFTASLDGYSLCTNITLYETINNCVRNLHKKNLYNGNLSKGDLFKLLETEIRKSFIFDYLFYKQVDGATMSSPLRPNLVNTFLRHYEKEWFNNCPIHFKARTYKRYVDNIFVPFSSKDHL